MRSRGHQNRRQEAPKWLTVDPEYDDLSERLVDPVLRLADVLALLGVRHFLDEKRPVHEQAKVAIDRALQAQLQQWMTLVPV